MNDEQLNQFWDEYRDGTLNGANRAAFEEYLRTHDPASAMWKAESQWLGMIGEVDTEDERKARPTPAFVQSVLSGWQSEQTGVIGRIGWRRYAGWAMGIAALVAVFVLGGMYAKMLNTTTPTPPDIAKVVPAKPIEKAPPDAIGLLMASAKDGYALAAAQPARIKQGFTSTAAFLDVSKLSVLFDPGVPDPAKFVEPKNGG